MCRMGVAGSNDHRHVVEDADFAPSHYPMWLVSTDRSGDLSASRLDYSRHHLFRRSSAGVSGNRLDDSERRRALRFQRKDSILRKPAASVTAPKGPH